MSQVLSKDAIRAALDEAVKAEIVKLFGVMVLNAIDNMMQPSEVRGRFVKGLGVVANSYTAAMAAVEVLPYG